MEYSVDYVQVLIDSLQKKVKLLDNIIQIDEEQRQLAAAQKLDLEQLDDTVNRKSEYIDELNKLDEGFQLIYDRVKPSLQGEQRNIKKEL